MLVNVLLFSIVWGVLNDKFGSKFVSVASTWMLSVALILFGFSYNFYWAIIARFVQGMSMGKCAFGD